MATVITNLDQFKRGVRALDLVKDVKVDWIGAAMVALGFSLES